MTVHFAYRSACDNPVGFHSAQFVDATILAWFQRIWREVAAGRLPADSEAVIGQAVYGFGSVLQAVANGGKPPQSHEELRDCLQGGLYLEEDDDLRFSPHCVQVYTNDDEIDLAIYIFDDLYLKKHPERAAFLVHGNRPLPTSVGLGGFRPPRACTEEFRPRGRGEGATYLWQQDYGGDSVRMPLDTLRINGVRLPDFARWLACTNLPENSPSTLYNLREELFPPSEVVMTPEIAFIESLRADPDDDTTWMAYADWLEEQGRPGPSATLLTGVLQRRIREKDASLRPKGRKNVNRPTRSVFEVERHVIRLCLHTLTCDYPRRKPALYEQLICFDDLWASGHPDLASSILRYASRWDFLEPGPRDE